MRLRMCHECNWAMNPIPTIIVTPPTTIPMPQPPIFNGPKEDKEESAR